MNLDFVDHLDSGFSWRTAGGLTPTTISFGFPTAGTFASGFTEASGFSQLTGTQAAAAGRAIAAWDDLIAPDFVAAGSGDGADIKFSQSSAGVSFAHAYFPGDVGIESSAGSRIQGSVWFRAGESAFSSPGMGTYGYQTFMHEVGHALGLNHAGDYNGGSPSYGDTGSGWLFAEDSWQYTIMSYFGAGNTGADWYYSGNARAQTPMLYDILTAQQIYGAEMTTRTGDTVYGFGGGDGDAVYDFSVNWRPVLTIWDAGGVDLIDLSGFSGVQTLDLREGHYSDVTGQMTKNLAIAFGTVIENGTGGSGADTIIGNDADNVLMGLAGDDEFYGGIGNDVISGGDGYDIVHIGATAAAITVREVADGLQVTGEGVDTINADVELIQFEDVALSYEELLLGADSGDIAPAGPSASVIGEAGSVSVSHESVFVDFSHNFENPVVFAMLPTANGSDPVSVRISNVTSLGFDIRLVEAPNDDGKHVLEDISFVVFEEGMHRLADGTIVEVGTAGISRSERISLASEFSERDPFVFAQTQTMNDKDFVWTRLDQVDESGFSLALQAAEGAPDPLQETVGWFAINSSTADFGGVTAVAGHADSAGIDHKGNAIAFEPFQDTPLLLANLTTLNGNDPASLRLRSASRDSANLFVSEETNADAEIRHVAEQADFFALDRAGLLYREEAPEPDTVTLAPRAIGEVGTVTLTEAESVISLTNEYENPVVFALSPSFKGSYPVFVRISEVTSDSVRLALQEPSNEKGDHRPETVHYVVLEAGSYVLEDGTRLEAGTVETDRQFETGMDDISFADGFSADPAIFSQVQTSNDPDFVVTRQDHASASGFSLAMQEEEGQVGTGHGVETVGWFAIEQGAGSLGNVDFAAGVTGNVNSSFSKLGFGPELSDASVFIAALASSNGSDTAYVRHDELTGNGVKVMVHEETSADAELNHKDEQVSWFAAEGTGVITGTAYAAERMAGPLVGRAVEQFGDVLDASALEEDAVQALWCSHGHGHAFEDRTHANLDGVFADGPEAMRGDAYLLPSMSGLHEPDQAANLYLV